MASDTARCAHMTCLTYCPSRGGSVAHGRQSVLKKTDRRPCAAVGWWRTDSVAGAAEDGGCGGWLRSACRAILAAAIAPRTDAHPFSGENGSVSVRGSARSQTTALRQLTQSRRTPWRAICRGPSRAAVRGLSWIVTTVQRFESRRGAKPKASEARQQGNSRRKRPKSVRKDVIAERWRDSGRRGRSKVEALP